MADSKITALTSISTSSDPANDPLVIVDVSDTSMAATGTTKKVTLNQLLATSPTATLASATITGAANFNGGALAGYLNGNLMFGSSGNIVNFFAQSNGFAFKENTGANNLLTISNAGVFGFFDGAGGTRMTLNSAGLGLGVSPAAALHAKKTLTGTASAVTNILRLDSGGSGNTAKITLTDGVTSDGYITMTGGAAADQILGFGVNAVNQMVVNGSGNVGIGVTPSARLHVEGTGPQARFSIASASDARHEYYRNGIREGLLFWDANVIGLYATQSSGEVVIASANTIRARVKAGGQVRFVPLASDPASAEAGDVYYNSSSNKLKCYNGSTWNDLF